MTLTQQPQYAHLIDQLAEQGWVVCDHFLPPDAVAALRAEAEARYGAGQFHRAAVGRAADRAVRDDVRGDSVRWLDPQQHSAAEQAYWQAINTLQAELNEALFLGIREGEFHYAQYPEGGFYQRHIDRFRDDDARVVSVVFYLNPAWQDEDGGHLRIWTDPADPEKHTDVAPLGGRLVLFLSERFWHEVLPAKRARWSLTGWFRRAA